MVATRASALADAMSTRRITRGVVGKNTTFAASQLSQLNKHTTVSEGLKKTPINRIPAAKVVKANKKDQTGRNSPPPIIEIPATKVVKADKKSQIAQRSTPLPSRRSARLLGMIAFKQQRQSSRATEHDYSHANDCITGRKTPLDHSIHEVQAPGVNSETTVVVDDLREVADHDTNLPPFPDNSADGQEEFDTTGEHPPTASVPAAEEEEEDDADSVIVGLLVPPFQQNVGPVPYNVEDPTDILYNTMLMVWDELSVEQRLKVLRVSEAIHSGDAADILEYNDLPLGHRAKIDPLVANTFNTIRAENYYRGVAALGQGFRLRLSTSLRPLIHFQI